MNNFCEDEEYKYDDSDIEMTNNDQMIELGSYNDINWDELFYGNNLIRSILVQPRLNCGNTSTPFEMCKKLFKKLCCPTKSFNLTKLTVLIIPEDNNIILDYSANNSFMFELWTNNQCVTSIVSIYWPFVESSNLFSEFIWSLFKIEWLNHIFLTKL